MSVACCSRESKSCQVWYSELEGDKRYVLQDFIDLGTEFQESMGVSKIVMRKQKNAILWLFTYFCSRTLLTDSW